MFDFLPDNVKTFLFLAVILAAGFLLFVGIHNLLHDPDFPLAVNYSCNQLQDHPTQR